MIRPALIVALLLTSVEARAAGDCFSLAAARAAYPGKYLSYRLVERARCWGDYGRRTATAGRARKPVATAPAPRFSLLWPSLTGVRPPEAAALYQREPMTLGPLVLDID